MNARRMPIFAILVFLTLTSTSWSGNQTGHIGKKLREACESFYPENKPGAVIIVRQGKIDLINQAFGLANLEQEVALQVSDLMPIGSVSKTFTAAVILKYVENNDLDLDDQIGKYLSEIPLLFRDVTIRQLLSHSSGVPNFNRFSLWREKLDQNLSPVEILECINQDSLDFKPGSAYSYSNTGYLLLGLLIEKLSKASYSSHLEDDIFKPATLSKTGIYERREQLVNFAPGYENSDGEIIPARSMSPSHLFSGGALYTCANDLSRWAKYYSKGEYISTALVNESYTPQISLSGEDESYGLGWYVSNLNNKKMLYHGGGIYGYIAHLLIIPEEDITVIIMSNFTDQYGIPTQNIAEHLALIAMGKVGPDSFGSTIEFSELQLKRYSGLYRYTTGRATGAVRKIIVEDGHVYYASPPMIKGRSWRRQEMFPKSEHLFVGGKMSRLIFHISEPDMITGFTLDRGDGKPFEAEKLK